MSNFCRKLRNPKTNKYQIAICLDDHYGEHKYGFGFKKDGSDCDLFEYKLEDLEIFNENETYD